jgi:peroxiredoxin family protein
MVDNQGKAEASSTSMSTDLQQKVESLEKRIAELEAKSGRMVIFLASGDLDKAMSAFNIAIASVAMGYQVVIYCTMFAINLLRNRSSFEDTTFLQKAAKVMMPTGPSKAALSKMHMLGMGTAFMKALMSSANFKTLPETIEIAKMLGVEVYACEMMMDVMGVKRDELQEGIHFGGASKYVDMVSLASVNLAF